MFVIEKMKLNKFKNRPIVSNRELFMAKGESPATIVSKDTADVVNEPTAEGATKLKVLGLAEEISKTSYAKHKEGEKAKDLDIKNAKDY